MYQSPGLLAEIVISLFLVIGGLFGLVGAIGLLKLKDTMQRLHAPTKATTLGVGGCLIGSMLYYLLIDGRVSFHELLIALFLFLTAPITANFIAKTWMTANLRKEDLPPSGRPHGWAIYDDPPGGDPRD
ncbi:cation:proton antiporter [Salipiger aestuarii]|uniref:Multicomponent K+:H+ antiporter subunit G n=1 Tax=Salipiger aestuarii TaxID=568098 RepID=A0A327Y1Z6_9RHOB|nr:Na+/H+ antiporter subunit G [Salipiger aestuarii]EIE52804.1 Na+/H+ antiporter subunit [Citreicella sp. 357]KAA8606219.1 cation:proton antiporter [Salipiger aestuarii]KAA8609163.1 cation:proton antiporter [Salipiger aestuarii]KAB2540884.1 cation:proton antiporter [Salipiger aestuarii]RAK12409.1 multicomponent K+:H+ antiporter subunit G [Salipiger aestuarii]